MNEQELDTRLQQLAAKQVAVPDLMHAVRRKIDLRARAGTRDVNRFAYQHMALLLPSSILAAVLVGISVQFAVPAIPPGNPQAAAAQALHLDIFRAAAIPSPIINFSKQKR